MTQEQLTKASRELAEKEGITPAAARNLIVFAEGDASLVSVPLIEETKDSKTK